MVAIMHMVHHRLTCCEACVLDSLPFLDGGAGCLPMDATGGGGKSDIPGAGTSFPRRADS